MVNNSNNTFQCEILLPTQYQTLVAFFLISYAFLLLVFIVCMWIFIFLPLLLLLLRLHIYAHSLILFAFPTTLFLLLYVFDFSHLALWPYPTTTTAINNHNHVRDLEIFLSSYTPKKKARTEIFSRESEWGNGVGFLVVSKLRFFFRATSNGRSGLWVSRKVCCEI